MPQIFDFYKSEITFQICILPIPAEWALNQPRSWVQGDTPKSVGG